MTTEEKLKRLKEAKRKYEKGEFFKDFEYKGIEVQISRENIFIKPKGKNIKLQDSTKNIENCINKMPAGKTLEGIPKEIWIKWLDEII